MPGVRSPDADDIDLARLVDEHSATLQPSGDDEILAMLGMIRQRRPSDRSEALLASCISIVREVARRAIGLQMPATHVIAGAAMCRGNLPVQADGVELGGVEILPIVWHALAGKSVHVIHAGTGDPYLLSQIGVLLDRLGIAAAWLDDSTSIVHRKASYGARVIVGSWSQFMSDYLRDHLRHNVDEMVQSPLHVAVALGGAAIILDRANVPVHITAPMHVSKVDAAILAAARQELCEKRDYLIRAGRVIFLRQGINRIVRLIGAAPWRETGPGVLLQHIETTLQDLSSGSDVPTSMRVRYATISVAGYFSMYETVLGVTSAERGAQRSQDLRERLWGTETPGHVDGIDFEVLPEAQRRLVNAMRRYLLLGGPPEMPLSSASTGGRLARVLDVLEGMKSSDAILGVTDYAAEADAVGAALTQGASEVITHSTRDCVRSAFLSILDNDWCEHRNALDFMRRHGNAIYSQRGAVLLAYERDAHERFASLLSRVRRRARANARALHAP